MKSVFSRMRLQTFQVLKTWKVYIQSKSHPEKKRAAKVSAARRGAFPLLFRTGGVLFQQGGVVFGKGGVLFRKRDNLLIFNILLKVVQGQKCARQKIINTL